MTSEQQQPTAAADWPSAFVHAALEAVVGADEGGLVRFMNPAAERLLGWRRQEAVGSLRLERLLGEGGLKELRRLLEAERLGGPGRLQAVRFDVLDRGGRRRPVDLSAVVLAPQRGVAGTCLVMRDLSSREELARRLAEAQRRLAPTERQRLLNELRGMAAHELNQPLTSILAYATLLARRVGGGAAERQAVERIRREAERMADIVRKIGEMSRYQTKDYVGSQRILDLDRGAERGSRPPSEER